MLKEFILAIIFGSLIGFGASNILVAVNKKQPPVNVSTPTLIPSPSPDTTVTPETLPTLTIDSPRNESVVTSANITLKGSAPASSFILVTTTQNSYQTTADPSGSFSLDLSLNLGANILKIKSLSPDNIENTAELLVTYSTAKIE